MVVRSHGEAHPIRRPAGGPGMGLLSRKIDDEHLDDTAMTKLFGSGAILATRLQH